MPSQPFFIKGDDNLRTLYICLLCHTKSASSESFHFIRNIISPLLPVAPIIRSGSRPLAKFLGLSAASLFLLRFVLSDSLSDKDFIFAPSFSWSAFGEVRNASINSGQSKFSSGSQGLSASVNPLYLRKNSTFPFTTHRSSIFLPQILLALPLPLFYSFSSVCFLFFCNVVLLKAI